MEEGGQTRASELEMEEMREERTVVAFCTDILLPSVLA